MVSPEGIGSEPDRPKSGRGLAFAVAALVIIGGFVAVGALTPAGEVAVETTTTSSTTPSTTTTTEPAPASDPETFEISQIAQGEPLNWEAAMILDDSYPIALFDHGESIFLFSTSRPNFSGFESGGLRGWRTEDGVSWEPLGEGIPQQSPVTHVSSTGQGLIALEMELESSGFTLWRSDDGRQWSAEEVAVDTGNDLLGFTPMAAGATDDLLVVVGVIDVKMRRVIEERLGVAIGDQLEVDLRGFRTEVVDDEITFSLDGPLGFPLVSFGAEELGLTADEREMLQSNTTVLVASPDGGWQQSEIPDAGYVESVTATPDGDIVALGYGRLGYTRWTSRDGLTWVETSASLGPSRIDEWGDRLAGPSGTGGASVLVEMDGAWTDIGPGQDLPPTLSWSATGTAAGPGGITTMITGWGIEQDTEPVTLTSGDTTLTLDFFRGRYELKAGDAVHAWGPRQTSPPWVDTDLKTGLIEFTDPGTGEHLGTYPLEVITAAQSSYWQDWEEGRPFQAFAFTPDGREWTIQDSTTIGERITVQMLEVTDSHVIAAGTNDAGMFDPTLSPGFGVWAAPLP